MTYVDAGADADATSELQNQCEGQTCPNQYE